MGAGQQSNIIQFRLNALLVKIRDEVLNLAASTSTPARTDAAYVDLAQKISTWELQLRSLSKNMSGLQKSLANEDARVRQLRREYRYSQHQSVRDRQKHVKDAQELLNQVNHVLTDLLERLMSPTNVDLVNLIHELLDSHLAKYQDLKELEQIFSKAQMHEATTAIVEVRSHMLRPADQVQPGGVDSIATLILLLRLVQIFALSLTTRKK